MFENLFHLKNCNRLAHCLHHGLRTAIASMLMAAISSSALADSRDEAFLSARDAFRASDVIKFEQFAQQLSSDYVLYPYIETWRFKLVQVEGKSPWPEATANQLLDKYAGSLPAELLRRDWLLNLARRDDWTTFRKQWAKLTSRDDPGLQCLSQVAEMASGADVGASARPLLLSPKELTDGCILLGERLLVTGKLSSDDLMQRVRVLTEAGSKGLARRVYDFMGTIDSFSSRVNTQSFEQAYDKPAAYLAKLPAKLTQSQQDLASIAIARIARDSPDDAAHMMIEQVASKLSDKPKTWAWSQVGLGAARKWNPRALEWYAQSSADTRTEEANEWYVRSALLVRNWKVVQKAIEAMPANQRADSAWTYWLGRARQAQGDLEASRKLYLQAASPFNFYGKLSLEELGLPVKLPPQAAPLTDAEFQAAAATPGFQRSLVWYQLGQRTEGFKEFNFQLHGLKDRQLIAAAEWAKRNELYDRAIAAADRTINEHDANLRFLTPYKDTMQLHAALAGMDPAWAYGLIRQESRFISVARSGVGASGLMQLMPATAQYMAKKLGMSDYSKEKVTDITINLQLGINYLRMMFDQLDNSQVLASAAYNAGPGRPRDWRARLPLGDTVEGAIFAEAIPFNETRDYVKKVLSNSTLYAALLEGKPQSLKARLGVIAGRGTINISAVDKIE